MLPHSPQRPILAAPQKTNNLTMPMADTYNYFGLANYVSNWKRLGFTDADLTRPGSDKFIDALVAHGTPDDIAKGLDEHLRAGANHVVIQVLGGPDKLLPTLAELAGPLGLSR
jgi:alkanesulfonate monooxygenase SsuD/methylene tetrahydromethanopterin reductase-like flavin-dependent oxidoreductase (luciferase family)